MTDDIPSTVAGPAPVQGPGQTARRDAGRVATGTTLIVPQLAALTAGGHGLVLLAVEIDQFALIGHLHGNEAAEVLVRQLAASVEDARRAGDRAMRSGPGQFVILTADDTAGAELLERSIRASFQRKAWPDLGPVTLSAGLARRYPEEPLVSWWARVAAALAQAKGAGGDHVTVDRRRNSSDDEAAAPVLRMRWQARFECGEPTIDRQHRELFERSEDVLESLRQGGARFGVELERLVAVTLAHFADEERILERRGYSGLAGHRRSHEDLAAKSMRLQAATATGHATREDLTRFLLGEVVADHMLTEDRLFAELFAQAPAR